jgi:hypothetical protein
MAQDETPKNIPQQGQPEQRSNDLGGGPARYGRLRKSVEGTEQLGRPPFTPTQYYLDEPLTPDKGGQSSTQQDQNQQKE